MNRSDRRAAERSDRARRTLEVPDGKLVSAQVLTPSGVQQISNWREPPAKKPGVHRWVAAVSHYLSPEQAENFAGASDSMPFLLDASSVMFVGVGCIDCEGPYQLAVGTPCPAGDEWGSS